MDWGGVSASRPVHRPPSFAGAQVLALPPTGVMNRTPTQHREPHTDHRGVEGVVVASLARASCSLLRSSTVTVLQLPSELFARGQSMGSLADTRNHALLEAGTECIRRCRGYHQWRLHAWQDVVGSLLTPGFQKTVFDSAGTIHGTYTGMVVSTGTLGERVGREGEQRATDLGHRTCWQISAIDKLSRWLGGMIIVLRQKGEAMSIAPLARCTRSIAPFEAGQPMQTVLGP